MVRRKVKLSERGHAWKNRLSVGEVALLDLNKEFGLRRLVCAGFCTFFREDSPEAMACAGFDFVVSLVRRPESGVDLQLVSETVAAAACSGASVDLGWDGLLEDLICAGCAFRPEGGCDYRDPNVAAPDKLEPCGGYVLLAALLSVWSSAG